MRRGTVRVSCTDPNAWRTNCKTLILGVSCMEESRERAAAPLEGATRWNRKFIAIAALLGVLVLIVIVATGGWRAAGDSVYPVRLNGKYGYIDSEGKLVVQPQFDNAAEFADGLAPVAVGKSWGYIDRKG